MTVFLVALLLALPHAATADQIQPRPLVRPAPPQTHPPVGTGRVPVRPLVGAKLLDPVTPACISSPFGRRVLPGRPLAGTFHNGVDLPAPAGAPVRAITAGVVMRVERHGPGGLQILVQHPGFVGIYSHFGSVTPAIADGQRIVYPGEKLGVVGHSGLTYGMHLFFGMMIDGQPVDPASYLGLSLCHAAHRTPADMLGADGKRPPTRSVATAR